jgi:hypothetical protein
MFNPALQSGFLHEDVEHVSILVDLAPETMLPATDTDEHLVHEPSSPSHANSGHAVFTSLTSSSMVRSMAIRSLARLLISAAEGTGRPA